MSRSASSSSPAPSERLDKLFQVAALVARLAGTRVRDATDGSLVDDAYDAGSTLARARFDELAERAAAVAGTGIEALLASGDVPPAALATLADALDKEIALLESLLAA